MRVRSARIAGPVEVDVVFDTVLYTVPAARVATVKTLRAVNTSGVDRHLDVCIDAHDQDHALLWGALVEAGDVFGDALEFTMAEGEQLRARADGAGVTVTVSGVVFVDIA